MATQILKMRNKFLIAFLAIGILPVTVIGVIALVNSGKALSSLAFGQLESVREVKKTQIQNYFNTYKQNTEVLMETVTALRQAAIAKLTTVQENKKALIDLYFRERLSDIAVMSKNATVIRALADFQATLDDKGRFDWDLFNFFEKVKYGNSLKKIKQEYGYDDLLLITRNGQVVYSANRESDLGGSVLLKPLRGSGLGRCFRKGLAEVNLQDFESYGPSEGRQRAFIGAPVLEQDGQVLGVLVLKLNSEAINTIAQRREGMGQTGETFLVGRKGDKTSYRSDRLLIEGKVGEKKSNEYIDWAMSASFEPLIQRGASGRMEIAKYDRLPLPGFEWVMVTTMDLEEVIAPRVGPEQEDYFSRYIRSYGLSNLLLITPSGDVIYSVVHGSDYKRNLRNGRLAASGLGELFRKVSQSRSFGFVDFKPYEPGGGVPYAFFGQPVIYKGHIDLVVALQISLDAINAIMLERAGMGATGETYLVGPDKIMRSDSHIDPSRFSVQACLTAGQGCTIETEAVVAALAGETNKKIGVNYLDQKVLSAYTPIQIWDTSWALVAEMGTAEAFAALEAFKMLAFLVAAIAIVAIVMVSLVAARHFARPISKLTTGAEQVRARNFDIRVDVKSNDELELLADTFNAMVVEIREYSRSLEHKVDLLKKADAEVRQSEEQLRAILNNASAVIYLKDLQGHYLLINTRFENLFGVSDEKMRGLTDHDLFPADMADIYRANDHQVVARNHAMEIEEIYSHEDGVHTYISIKFPLRDKNGEPYAVCGISTDINDRKQAEAEKVKLEAQLRQAHKMEAVGTLAGGIAHDFNNILGIILGNTELAMDDVPEWNPAYSNLKEVLTASLRAKDVVSQLLSFSRKTEQEMKPVKLDRIILESLKLIRASIPTSIAIEKNITDDCGTISADPTQMHQVIINLCTNAAHAMQENGGTLQIELDKIDIGKDDVSKYFDVKPGLYIKLMVSDNGCGISNDIKGRIFDPYFTTKDIGKGTGMGLSVVHGIVINHGGAITLYSKPDRGTTVKILFPVIDAEPIREDLIAETLPTGNEKVLFIDDEKALAKMGQLMLEKLGYRVEPVTNPLEALELLRSESHGFDLIITDMTMPQMTGEKLIAEALKISPGMPIILCTGFSEKINKENANQIGVHKYIEKPMDKHELATAVREVLDSQ